MTTAFVHDALPGRVVFGAGRARRDLAAEVGRFGDRVLVITTGRGESLARELAAPLGNQPVFTGVRPHVPVEVADAAADAAAGTDVLLCIGGGSTTGTAKAVALRTGQPIVAVPTTYSGSEVTPVWGQTVAQRKTTGIDVRVLPRTVVYDPELTVTLPADLSAVSGLNAMAHGIEAFWAPGANPVTSAFAEQGIRALAAGLPGVVSDGRDLTARGDTLIGAWLAGAAFAAAGSGLHHKICHVLGGAYDLPHAQTHAIVLPHVLAFNAPGAPEAARRIAAALGADEPVGGLVRLSAALGAPEGLREIGLGEEHLDEATDLVLEKVPADNPVPAGRDDIARLLRRAWSGAPTLETTP